jgi:hypothetical protein
MTYQYLLDRTMKAINESDINGIVKWLMVKKQRKSHDTDFQDIPCQTLILITFTEIRANQEEIKNHNG